MGHLIHILVLEILVGVGKLFDVFVSDLLVPILSNHEHHEPHLMLI